MRIAVTLCAVAVRAVAGLAAPGAVDAAPAVPNGVGPRVAFHELGDVGNFPYSSPHEDLKLTPLK